MVLLSFGIPATIEYYQFSEDSEASSKQAGSELKFMGGLYFLCLLFISGPSLAMKWFSPLGGSDLCQADSAKRQAFSDQMLLILIACSILYLTVFNLLHFGQTRQVIIKSIAWIINSIAAASLVIYSFPVVLITVVFIFPLLHYC